MKVFKETSFSISINMNNERVINSRIYSWVYTFPLDNRISVLNNFPHWVNVILTTKMFNEEILNEVFNLFFISYW